MCRAGAFHSSLVFTHVLKRVPQLQSFFLVSDDMIDGSITRRGQPCWYRASGVGLIAVNDSVMLEGAIYHLLKTYFRGESYYVDLLEVLHETSYKTEMGQLVDMITASEGVVDLSKFSLQKYGSSDDVHNPR